MSGTAVADSSYNYPTPVSPTASQVQIVVVPTPSAALYAVSHNFSLDATSKSAFAWTNLTGQIGKTAVAAVSRDAGIVDLFVTGMDGTMTHKYATNNSWGPYEPHSGNLNTAPTVITWGPNRLDVFATFKTDALYTLTWAGSQGWQPWTRMGGTWAGYEPTAVTWGQGRLDVFVVGKTDNALYHAFLTPDVSGWPSATIYENLGGYLTGRPAAVSLVQGRLDVFVRGGDAGLWHLEYWASGFKNWATDDPKNWTRVDGGDIKAEPDAVVTAADRIDVFVWGVDGGYQRRSLVGSKWNPVEDLGGKFSGPPKAVIESDRFVHVYGFSTTGELMHRSWDQKTSTWATKDGFESLGKP